MSTEDNYQAFVKAAINLATAVDVADQIATDPSMPADRSPRAERLREQHRAEDLAAFRAAYARWIGQGANA